MSSFSKGCFASALEPLTKPLIPAFAARVRRGGWKLLDLRTSYPARQFNYRDFRPCAEADGGPVVPMPRLTYSWLPAFSYHPLTCGVSGRTRERSRLMNESANWPPWLCPASVKSMPNSAARSKLLGLWLRRMLTMSGITSFSLPSRYRSTMISGKSQLLIVDADQVQHFAVRLNECPLLTEDANPHGGKESCDGILGFSIDLMVAEAAEKRPARSTVQKTITRAKPSHDPTNQHQKGASNRTWRNVEWVESPRGISQGLI